MQEPQISTDELCTLMQQLYPDQFARAVAELKAAKYREILEQIAEATEQREGESNESDPEGQALREVPRATGTDSASSDS